jgi:RNA polymerase sigma-70 factor (ECF subfamily)
MGDTELRHACHELSFREATQMMSHKLESIEERIRTAVEESRHPQAFELLAQTYYALVFRYCCHMLGGERAHVEDVTQRVFFEAGKGLDKFRGEASVKGWLLAIAYKVCLAHIARDLRRLHLWQRHKETILCHAHPEPPQGPEAERLAAERPQWLAAALTKLPPDKRSLIVMRFGIGLQCEATIAELEQITGRSRATVYRDLNEALDTLKRIMNDGDEFTGPATQRLASCLTGDVSAP